MIKCAACVGQMSGSVVELEDSVIRHSSYDHFTLIFSAILLCVHNASSHVLHFISLSSCLVLNVAV